jgi:protein-tyrosine phosphatase
MIDFHNHLMPGVDDGAQTIEESCAALSAFADDGVSAVITTPHIAGGLTLNQAAFEQRMAEIDQGWQTLTEHARSHHPEIAIHRGAEVMLDTPEPDLSDPRIRLAGGPFVLVEFPFMTVPPRSMNVLFQLGQQGCQAVLAHPERYAGFAPDFSLAEQWRQSGVHLQVNGASLLGSYGREARQYARGLLERGWADYLCSDYHARGRSRVREYRRLLEELGLAEHARLLTEVNPGRILTGQPPISVPPIRAKRTLWARVTELFREMVST